MSTRGAEKSEWSDWGVKECFSSYQPKKKEQSSYLLCQAEGQTSSLAFHSMPGYAFKLPAFCLNSNIVLPLHLHLHLAPLLA